MMSLSQWVLLLMACAVAIIGLFLAAGAGGGTLYGIGLLGFVVAVIYAFALVKRYFDQVDAGRH